MPAGASCGALKSKIARGADAIAFSLQRIGCLTGTALLGLSLPGAIPAGLAQVPSPAPSNRGATFRFHPKINQLIGQVAGLPSSRVLSVALDAGNKLWAGTREGLAWVDTTARQTAPHSALVRNRQD